MAGRCADELPGFFREKLVDRLGVLPLDRFAGENDRPAVDLAALQSGRAIGVVDEVAQLVGVDRSIGKERGQHDRRPPCHLPVDDDETARQPLGLPLQRHLREQKMRGRASDIDADRFELDGFLAPDIASHFQAIGFRQLAMLVEEIGVVHSSFPVSRQGRVARFRCQAVSRAPGPEGR